MSNLVSNLSKGTVLGSGYFGVVYKGDDPIHGEVAVKVFEKKPKEDAQEWLARKQNLLHEGQRLKSAEHNNIVRVLQILESSADDEILLVMEYCSNGCLQEFYENGPMPLTKLRSYLTDAVLGLQAIHSRGMIHRDIKPSNILIDHNGRAKIADFGLVTDEVILGYASGIGYTDHLAKEVFTHGLTSIRTDVWALGMTVYRLLHGQEYYNHLPDPSSLIPYGNFALKLPWLPHIPDRWRRFVRRAMHDDPNKRFQDATELLESIANLPIKPDWVCQYSLNEVLWYQSIRDRQIKVKWIQHSPRRHKWEARSYPLGAGRERQLGGSVGLISKKRALAELNQFLRTG